MTARAQRNPGRWAAAFQRLGISGQLMTVFAVIGSLWIATVAVAASGLLSTRAQARNAAGTFSAFQLERDAYEGWLTQDDQSNMYAALAVLRDPRQAALLATTWAQVGQGHAQAVANLQRLIAAAPTASLKRAVRAALADVAAYSVFTAQARASVVAGNPAQAVDIVAVENANISNRVQADFDSLAKPFAAAAAADRAATDATVSRSLTTTVLLAVVGLLLAGAILLLFARSLGATVRSVLVRLRGLDEHDLGDLCHTLEAVAARDLTVGAEPTTTPISHHREDELGQMTRTFNDMLAKTHAGLAAANEMRASVAQMLREISDTSRTVASASAQMAAASEDAGRAVDEISRAMSTVAQGAEQQVISLEAAHGLTSEVAAKTRNSASGALETVSAAQSARATAAEGVQAVDRATEAMRSVRATSEEVAGAINILGATSKEIGGIVETITGIAQQTNLLALNAAIEAARAGEQGRGFAVVAEEVRALAEESQGAAASIAKLIELIQSETARAVQIAELSSDQARESTGKVEAVREAFERIDASVQGMGGRVEEIAATIEQIATSGESMQMSVSEVVAVSQQAAATTEQVSTTTHGTAASTEQLAAGAQQLSQTASQLRDLVGQFTLA